jgi:hypothetical protein
VVPTGGFAGNVALSASGLPSGLAASLSPLAGGASTLTVAAAASAQVGASSVTVTGASGALRGTVTVPITVSAAASAAGPGAFAGSSSTNGPWFDEDDVSLTTATDITAMTLTITVPVVNASYNGIYDTVGSQIAESHAIGPSLVYTFTLSPGQGVYSGSYRFAAQMNSNGTPHAISSDAWTVVYTAGGVTYTQSGKI